MNDPAAAANTGPLAGVKVIELGGIGPGPHAGMILADLGADVVRVRRPDPGERSDGDKRPLQMPAEHVDLMHRGKRVVDLDVKSEPGALLELAAKADVLLDCFRPGTCERLGVGPDDCAAANPRLIFARITGWGQAGPLATTAGHDINYLSKTGALSAIGYRDRPPVAPLNLVADFGGGSMFVLLGIVAALYERERSGEGQVIDAAMVDVPNQFDLGRYDEMKAIFTERFATRTRDEWAEVFAGTDACATPVLTWTEAAHDEHLAARSTVITVDGVQQAAPAPRFSRTTPGTVGRPPKGTTAIDRVGW